MVGGLISTNGREGSVEYQWTRSDGVPTEGRHSQPVAAGTTSVPVSFALTVTGPGELHEGITLAVLKPAPLGPYTTTVVYRCGG